MGRKIVEGYNSLLDGSFSSQIVIKNPYLYPKLLF